MNFLDLLALTHIGPTSPALPVDWLLFADDDAVDRAWRAGYDLVRMDFIWGTPEEWMS